MPFQPTRSHKTVRTVLVYAHIKPYSIQTHNIDAEYWKHRSQYHISQFYQTNYKEKPNG